VVHGLVAEAYAATTGRRAEHPSRMEVTIEPSCRHRQAEGFHRERCIRVTSIPCMIACKLKETMVQTRPPGAHKGTHSANKRPYGSYFPSLVSVVARPSNDQPKHAPGENISSKSLPQRTLKKSMSMLPLARKVHAGRPCSPRLQQK
jgi:hypothetical protein